MQIVDFLYNLARENKALRGFIYNKLDEKGAGNDFYPLGWLDDPITGTKRGNTIVYRVNMDFLGIPANDAQVTVVQSAAFLVGLSFAEVIKQRNGTTGISIEGFSFVSLRKYNDDDAAGYRFTFDLIAANPVSRCEEYFDPTKQLPTREPLPSFETDHPDGCAVFNEYKGLPNFSVEI